MVDDLKIEKEKLNNRIEKLEKEKEILNSRINELNEERKQTQDQDMKVQDTIDTFTTVLAITKGTYTHV